MGLIRGAANAFALIFVLAYAFAAPTAASEGEKEVWTGMLRMGGLQWDIALRNIKSDNGAPEMDVISLWRARMPLEDFRLKNSQLSFSLPEGLGEFKGEIRGNTISGTVGGPNGAEGELKLLRSAEPAIAYHEFEIDRDGVTIAATLATPAGKGPFPVVAILHGGGDSSREAPPYRFMADFLPRHGIAVIIYDKRGNGASSGDWREVGFETRAEDVAALLRRAQAFPRIDASRLGLVGVSQGSWVSTAVDSIFPNLTFIVHISGPATTVWEADTYANRVDYRADGFSDDEIERALAIWTTSLEVTRRPKSQEAKRALEAAIDAAREDAWFKNNPYEPDPVNTTFRKWYRLVMDYDPREALRRSDTRMLWIYGDMDSESDVFANLRELGKLRREHEKPFYVSVYPRAGHGVMIPLTMEDEGEWPMLTAAPGFFEDMLFWMQSEFQMH